MKQKPLSLTIPSREVCLVFKEFFGYGLNKSAFLYRSLLDHVLSPYGVIAPELGILYLLKEPKIFSQNDLVLQLGIDKASMVKMLDQLELKGLTERKMKDGDRRIKLVSLTSEGKKFLKKIGSVHKKVEAKALACFNEKEKKLMKGFLPRLLLNLIEHAKETKTSLQ
jgi:DNA-binding MarR family transcriptional regulator